MSFVSPVTLSLIEGRQTKNNIVVPAYCHNNRSSVRCLKCVQPQPVLLVTPWLLFIRYLPWFGMITSSHSNFMKQREANAPAANQGRIQLFDYL